MNYHVYFLKIERKENKETGKSERTGKEELLGQVAIDDIGTENMTLMAKAFRHAPPYCLYADKVIVEKARS